MKKSLLALAALTAFAGVASAQSSVTAFGIVDVNMRAVDNGSAGTIYSLSQAGMNTSRLGFRGIEDLGGGLRAGFWIEGQIDPDTGATAGGQTWQRRSTVSLIGNFGEVRLGRDEHATYKIRGYEYFNTNGVATGYNLFSNLGSGVNGVRNSNMVAYILPTMGGLFGQFQVAAGEGSTTPNKYMGGILGYAAGPFKVAGSYGVWSNDGISRAAMPDDLETFNVGLEWNFGAFKVLGIYEESKLGSRKQKIYSIPVAFKMGAGTFKGQYTVSDGSADVYSAQMFGVGYTYDMSKRTALYAHYGAVDNEGNATTGARFTASGSGPTMTRGGEKSTGYEFGIRHAF